MATHKALVLSSFDKPISLETVPTPTATPGSAILRVLAAGLPAYARDIFTGKLPYVLTLPQVLGPSCVARVIEVGPDAIVLKPGQLVFVDPTIAARDDSDCNFLLGLHGGVTEESQRLMRESWRDGCYAEIVKAPLENCYILDEEVLIGKLGYKIHDLANLSCVLVPFGGLEEAGVGAGKTVIVAPATGKFSGGAVLAALAMGAKVIAAGRNEQGLEKLKTFPGAAERLLTVKLVSDAVKDTAALLAATGGKGAQAYIDFSPPAAGAHGTPTHITACLNTLKRGGIAMFMGGIYSNVEVNYIGLMMRNITIKAKFMYERAQAKTLIKMIEFGNLRIGEGSGMTIGGTFGLEEIEKALDLAEKGKGWGGDVFVVPNRG
ncbi:isopropanol dehydrogenase [Lepidopterella palustris CBS 459.81]|uniref:Isopropanol dehydrogenase n=1 Tax=Lepidopterella palustris CBS 459.81 TaxID=1314670 RepID=A0A8E2EHY2_9PEZI|nr:isopropanol dehydrogenase [Lepidopterella palustris CBS 459.81]